MPISKLLNLPYGSYLMVRLDYKIICGDELEAKIMRIVEMYMEDERKALYKAFLNDPKNSAEPEATVEITKDVWPAISHRLFKNDLYDQEMSENTLKRAIKSLITKKFIKMRDDRKQRYEAPKYQINTEEVQKELDTLSKLGKSEYQKLMVSKIDGIKNSSRQKMTPGDHQNLTPSGDSMVSKFDPNSRKVTVVEEKEEECTLGGENRSETFDSATATPSTHALVSHPDHNFIWFDDLMAPSLMVVRLTPAFPHPHSSEIEDKRRERIAGWEVKPYLKSCGFTVAVQIEHENGEDITVEAVAEPEPYIPDWSLPGSDSYSPEENNGRTDLPNSSVSVAAVNDSSTPTPGESPGQTSAGTESSTRSRGGKGKGKNPTTPSQDKPARGKQPKEEIVFTAGGQKVYSAWSSLFKVAPPVGPQTIKCANALYDLLLPWCHELHKSCAQLLDDIQKQMYKNDKTKFYARGITLCDIHRDFEKWQSAQTREQTNQTSDTNDIQDWIRESDARRAAEKASGEASKLTTQQQVMAEFYG